MSSSGYSRTRLARSNRAESWCMRRVLCRIWKQPWWCRDLNSGARSLSDWRSATHWCRGCRLVGCSLCGRRNRAATVCLSPRGSAQPAEGFRLWSRARVLRRFRWIGASESSVRTIKLTLFSVLRNLCPASQPQAWGHGGGKEGEWTVSGGCDPQVYLFDHLSALVFRTNEKTAPQILACPLLTELF